MSEHTLRLGDPWLEAQLGRLIGEARDLVGWSQRELAARAGTSQPTISRMEAGSAAVIDLRVLDRVIEALGMRGTLALDAPHLRDRTRQRDPVHARLVAYVAGRLERHGWRVETEVQIGDPVPRGWIDLLAVRPVDRSGLIGEVKGDIPDLGELQRQVAFYGRAGPMAARRFGWQFERSAVFVATLHSGTVAERLRANRDLVRRAFAGRPAELDAWIRSGAGPPPASPTIAVVDPLSRRARWLRPMAFDDRRSPAPYADYADAAARIRPRRRPP